MNTARRDLDYRPAERAKVLFGWALVTLFVLGCILAPLALGGLLIAAFGW